MQLESIGYEDNTRVIVEGGERESSFSASPNIVLEIWNSILLIEAKKMIINGETYELMKKNIF